jgi:hypothetical protein
MSLSQLAGILPALVFPTATLVQLVRVIRNPTAAGISLSTWALFGVANLAVYCYVERYAEWQAILGMLVTAVLDFAIVGLVIVHRRSARNAARIALDESIARAARDVGLNLVESPGTPRSVRTR